MNQSFLILWWNTAEISHFQVSCILPLFWNLPQCTTFDIEMSLIGETMDLWRFKVINQYERLCTETCFETNVRVPCDLEMPYFSCRKSYRAQTQTFRDLWRGMAKRKVLVLSHCFKQNVFPAVAKFFTLFLVFLWSVPHAS